MASGILIACGVALFLYGVFHLWRAHAATRWPEVPGEILRADVADSIDVDHPDYPGVGHHWIVTVRYQYKVKGRSYQGKRLSFDNNRFYDGERANQWLWAHKAGDPVKVRVNPRNPADAVLDTTPPRDMGGWAIMGAVLAAIGFVVRSLAFAVAVALLAAGCATQRPAMTAAESRALIASHMPNSLADKEGWAADIYTPMSVMEIPVTPDNICAILSVTEQESGYKADPAVPNLAKIAWEEIERQREKLHVPKLVLDAALSLQSRNGRTYKERIDAARTERELSDVFEDMIDRVPLGRTFFADRNPVRTGGPMQVGVAFAQEYTKKRPYPYPLGDSIRDEVFTRRGGMYFGIAHLLDYPASYDRYLYRYADFNAGHYASRNAALQAALALVSGTKLALDGDLVLPGAAIGETETAARGLARELGLDPARIRRDLEREKEAGLERTETWQRVFELADRKAGKPLPRAVLPGIELKSPKITRALTTAWFAERVVTRHRQCLARAPSPSPHR